MSSYLQQVQQQLFSKIDSNGDGNITQSELDQAVTSAGGTTAAANALYGDLDPNDTGSVSEQQFAQNLPTVFGPEMGGQLIAVQAQSSGGLSGTDRTSAFANQLFSQITKGGSTLTQSALEQAVTSAGGTTASADALYAQLDPNNTGSVTEEQFAANLPSVFNASTSDSGTSASDAIAALMKALASPPGSEAHGAHHHHHHHLETDAASNATSNTNDSSAQDAVDALMQSLDTSSTQPAAATGNTAQDALFDLMQADGSSGASASTSTLPGASFGNISQQMLSLMIQMQSQNQFG